MRVGEELEALLEEVLEDPDRNQRERLIARLEARRSESAHRGTSGHADP